MQKCGVLRVPKWLMCAQILQWENPHGWEQPLLYNTWTMRITMWKMLGPSGQERIYRIRAYFSFIHHESYEIVSNLEVTLLVNLMPKSFNQKTQNYSSEIDQRRINHKPTRSQVCMPSGWEIRLYTIISLTCL